MLTLCESQKPHNVQNWINNRWEEAWGKMSNCTSRKKKHLPLQPNRDLLHSPSLSRPTPAARGCNQTSRTARFITDTAKLLRQGENNFGWWVTTYWRLLRKPVLRSSISSMGEEEERRELSEGLKEGLLLSPCSTDKELGLSSRAWAETAPVHTVTSKRYK